MEPAEPKPTAYEICVEGTLDPCWSKRLGAVSIHSVEQSETAIRTVLSREVFDQATLFGLLLALYDLKLTLISVRRLPDA